MIKDIDLTPDQNRSLEHAVNDLLTKERGSDLDVEVTHLQDEGDCYKLFYSYENPKTHKEMHGTMYATMSIRGNKIEDFEEKTFTKENLLEGTWAFPDTMKLVGDLEKLLSKPLIQKDATDKLYSIFGDDDLFDNIDSEDDSNADVRPIVRHRLERFLTSKNVTKALPSEVVKALGNLTESLNEKVHTLSNPHIKPRSGPDEKARIFDKVNPKNGSRPNRSVLKKMAAAGDQFYALEYSHEKDYIAVHVMRTADAEKGGDYYGINVLFFPGGKIDASTGDSLADKQWKNHKKEIVRIAKDALKNDKTLPHAYDGLGGVDMKNPGGKYYDNYLDGKTESLKPTFKQFLVLEAKVIKIKEPGWYVVDHMDWPVDGPMQERGAKEMADEMNAEHAAKRGKGDIDPYSAEYYSDYEIRRMNEGKLALKQGGASLEDASFGFESRKNAITADKALKAADVPFTRTSAGGIQYFHFDSMPLMRKGVKIVKPLINKSEESEWGK